MRKLSETEVKTTFPKLAKTPHPPKTLYIEGDVPDQSMRYLCVVGSRRHTPYGKEVCEMLIESLRGYPIVIVSGLALGIDGIAHRSALKAGLKTIAIPGSGLDRGILYPATHQNLAEEILKIDSDGKTRGALITEFDPLMKAEPWTFPQRNRIMAGISDATLIIEADIKSGTLITANLATEYNRDVLAVPGSIFSTASYGPNDLIHRGAIPVRTADDILEVLHIKKREEGERKSESESSELSPTEVRVLEMLLEPLDKPTLINRLVDESSMKVQEVSIVISLLEIKGIIQEKMGLMIAR